MKKHSDGIFFLTKTYAPVTDFFPLDNWDGIELDLGCGDGDFSVAIAKLYPNRLVLASDLLLGRIRKVRNKVERFQLPNLKPLRSESRMLVSRSLPDACLTRLHLLCPDPWPKERHKFHRFLTSDIMAQLARILKKDGIFHFSSDDQTYFETSRNIIDSSGLFQSASMDTIADIAHIKTNFEQQWEAEGRIVQHCCWRKSSSKIK